MQRLDDDAGDLVGMFIDQRRREIGVIEWRDEDAVGAEAFTFQIGTLSGNPLAAVAGLKTLEVLRRDGSYETLHATGKRLMAAMSEPLTAHGIAHQIVDSPVLFDVIFTARPVRNYRDIQGGDDRLAGIFNKAVRERGVLKPAAKLYPHLALSETDLQETEAAFAHAAAQVAAAVTAA